MYTDGGQANAPGVMLYVFALCQSKIPYWHKVILHDYTMTAPAGCNLIRWGLRDNGV